jgi:beta-lactam-binding protein with PASTA domain
MSRRRRRPVEPWRQRALAQREAERARAAEPTGEPAPIASASSSAPAASSNGGSRSRGAPATPAAPASRDPDVATLERASLPPPPKLPGLEAGDRPARERRRGPRFNLLSGTLLLSGVALAGGFLVVNLVLMPSFTRQGAEVHVPEVTGLSEREAERVLAAQDLRLSKISEQWSPDVPRGFIALQDPQPGGVVKRGRRISVIVSLGAQGTSVPLLDGSSERQAGILLESAGLRKGKVARVFSDEVGKDLVIATDPPGETVVEQETVVDLLVSLGPPTRGYVLPDLTGRNLNTVARGLRDEGFAVALRVGGSRQPSDAVAGQEPPPGHRVAQRDSIVLYYRP